MKARQQFDEGADFTVAVEEEFAILDPVTLGLTNSFEDLQARAAGAPSVQSLVRSSAS